MFNIAPTGEGNATSDLVPISADWHRGPILAVWGNYNGRSDEAVIVSGKRRNL